MSVSGTVDQARALAESVARDRLRENLDNLGRRSLANPREGVLHRLRRATGEVGDQRGGITYATVLAYVGY